MNYIIAQNELSIYLEKDIYPEEVVFKCFYWYGKDYSVDISAYNKDKYLVRFIPLKEELLKQDEYNSLLSKIKQDLIDFKLRNIVSKETQVIRELIIAKAFAHYEPEEDPKSEISDPVGFSPNK